MDRLEISVSRILARAIIPTNGAGRSQFAVSHRKSIVERSWFHPLSKYYFTL